MATLITGGSGLIGARMTRDLAKEGEKVVVYDLKIDNEVLGYLMTEEELNNVVCVEGDILDYDKLVKVCRDNGVTKLIHTASMMGNAGTPLVATHVNTGGMMAVLEAARELNMEKVVYTSTNSVFAYDADYLIKEDQPYHPDSNYGCTKVYNELSAEMYHRLYGLDVTGIRVGAQIFGEYQKRGMTASIAAQAVYNPAAGLPGHVPFNDKQVGWIYCDDVADCHVKALKVKREEGMPGVYNISGPLLDMDEIVAFVKELIPDAQIEVDNVQNGMKFWRLDTTATERDLGYKNTWDVWEAWKKVIKVTRESAGLPVDNIK